jgi:hypothetical protein
MYQETTQEQVFDNEIGFGTGSGLAQILANTLKVPFIIVQKVFGSISWGFRIFVGTTEEYQKPW